VQEEPNNVSSLSISFLVPFSYVSFCSWLSFTPHPSTNLPLSLKKSS
jgi:hypothetical protein